MTSAPPPGRADRPEEGRPRRAIVVGAGISGLACARRLLERARERRVPLDLTLLEAGGRAGGAIRTESRDGFLLE